MANIIEDSDTNIVDCDSRSAYDLVKSLPSTVFTNRCVLMHSSTDD